MIGVFDSGYGGLTVFKPLIEKFTECDFLYLGDNARAPYGSRSEEEIFEFTNQAVDWLFEQGCELIIIACNTASSQALRKIQKSLPGSKYSSRRVLGVLVPVAEAVAKTNPKEIGILATEATINSKSYEREIYKLTPDIKIISQAAPLLVPLIEEGKINNPETKKVLKKYLEIFKKEHINNIVLGCTHYPFIKHLILKEMPEAKIFDSPSIIPSSLEKYLDRHPEIESRLSKNGTYSCFTTGSPAKFDDFADKFLNLTIFSEKVTL